MFGCIFHRVAVVVVRVWLAHGVAPINFFPDKQYHAYIGSAIE
jgi:hypothetical protein